RRNAAEGDAAAAAADGEPFAVQREVYRLTPLHRKLCLELDLAGERNPGEPRPRCQIGKARTERAAGQQSSEVDIQIAIDAAAGRLDTELADGEIGLIAELRLDAEHAVETAGAERAGDRNLRLCRISNL